MGRHPRHPPWDATPATLHGHHHRHPPQNTHPSPPCAPHPDDTWQVLGPLHEIIAADQQWREKVAKDMQLQQEAEGLLGVQVRAVHLTWLDLTWLDSTWLDLVVLGDNGGSLIPHRPPHPSLTRRTPHASLTFSHPALSPQPSHPTLTPHLTSGGRRTYSPPTSSTWG
jgi:hypothetical protein